MAHFTFDKQVMEEQFEKVQTVCDIVSYSSKTNPQLTSLLQNKGAWASIHFPTELRHCTKLEKVWYFAQAWDTKLIKNLIEKNVTHFVIDNTVDADTLLQYLEINKVDVSVLLRAKIKERSVKTERYYVFGMHPKTVVSYTDKFRAHGKVGVHTHRKTQNMSDWNLQFYLENTFSPEFVQSLHYLNIGGGLPSEYANTNVKVIASIITKLQKFHGYCKQHNITLICEPGRFIAAPSMKLVTKIIGVHDNTIVVDASVYNSNMDAIVVPVKLKIEGEGEGDPYVIKGCTPCSMDLFRYKVYLSDVTVGNTITFLNAGAYNFSTDFCDLPTIEVQ